MGLSGDRVGPIQHRLPGIVFEIEDQHLAAIGSSEGGVGILQFVCLEGSFDDAAGRRIVKRVVCDFEIGVVLRISILKVGRPEVVVACCQDIRHLTIEHMEGFFSALPLRVGLILIYDVAALNYRLDIESLLVVENPVHLADQSDMVAIARVVILNVGQINHRPSGIWGWLERSLHRSSYGTWRGVVLTVAAGAAPDRAVHTLRRGPPVSAGIVERTGQILWQHIDAVAVVAAGGWPTRTILVSQLVLDNVRSIADRDRGGGDVIIGVIRQARKTTDLDAIDSRSPI